MNQACLRRHLVLMGKLRTYTNEKPVSVLLKKTFLCEMQKGINYISLELVELTNLSEVKTRDNALTGL